MKFTKIIFTLFLICSLLVNNFYYEPQKVDAFVVVDDIAIAMIATALVATGVTITASNMPSIKNWCSDLYNNSTNGISTWVNSWRGGVVAGTAVITTTANILSKTYGFLDTKPKDVAGNINYIDIYYGRTYNDINTFTSAYTSDFNIDNVKRLGVDLGASYTGTRFSYNTNYVARSDGKYDLWGSLFYDGVQICPYKNLGRIIDLTYTPKFVIMDDGLGYGFWINVLYYTGTGWTQNFAFSPIAYGYLPMTNSKVTVAPTTATVPYAKTSLTTDKSVYVPSKIDNLVGATSSDVLSGPVNLPTTTPTTTTTPMPTTAPINNSVTLPWSGSWTGNFLSNPANLRFGSATGSLTGDCVGTWTGTISNTGVFSGSCVLADTTLLTGTVTSSIALTSDFTIPRGGLNFAPLQIAGITLMNKFPFCIPFDFIKSFNVFSGAGVQIPKWEIPMPDNNKLVIDFAIVDPLAPFSRWFFLLLFNFGLLMWVNKMYGGVL